MSNYRAKITAHSLAETKNTHTPYVKLILETYTDLDNNEEVHKVLYASLWLTDKTAERTMQTLRKLGYQSDSMNELNDGVSLAGTMCEVTTEWNEFNGQQREEVVFVNEEGNRARRGYKPMDDDGAKRICNKYNLMLRNIAKQKPNKERPKFPKNVQDAAKALNAEATTEKPSEEELEVLPF